MCVTRFESLIWATHYSFDHWPKTLDSVQWALTSDLWPVSLDQWPLTSDQWPDPTSDPWSWHSRSLTWPMTWTVTFHQWPLTPTSDLWRVTLNLWPVTLTSDTDPWSWPCFKNLCFWCLNCPATVQYLERKFVGRIYVGKKPWAGVNVFLLDCRDCVFARCTVNLTQAG